MHNGMSAFHVKRLINPQKLLYNEGVCNFLVCSVECTVRVYTLQLRSFLFGCISFGSLLRCWLLCPTPSLCDAFFRTSDLILPSSPRCPFTSVSFGFCETTFHKNIRKRTETSPQRVRFGHQPENTRAHTWSPQKSLARFVVV